MRLALNPDEDQDFDGLPNAWEVDHALDPYSASDENGECGDSDQDGATNFQEFVAGTDPRSATSALRLQVASIASAHNLLCWSSTIGRKYTLEISQDGRAFTNHLQFLTPRSATSTTEVFVDELTLEEKNISRFYRLRVEK